MARITADTNILLRATMMDDATQSPVAQRLLEETEVVSVPTSALCEFAWVLARLYKLSRAQIAVALRGIVASANVRVESASVEAGLAVLDLGGDFADGVIAHDGVALGGVTFVSFDRGAVTRLSRLGVAAAAPSDM